jgi:hypothetical protein
MTVAQSPLGSVTICPDCGVVHLVVSHVTLRFTSDAFGALEQLVTQAQARLALGAPGLPVLPAADLALH